MPLAVGPGTGVSERLGIVPSPLGPWAYRGILELAPESKLFCMIKGGLGRLESTYLYQEEAWLKFAGEGSINLAVHSQNAIHGALFAVRHPDKVSKAILINGPFFGADVARRFRGLPCADDMRRQSQLLGLIREEITAVADGWLRQRQPEAELPELHFVGLKHDLVVPHDSPYLLHPAFFNHCLGQAPRPGVEEIVKWHEVKEKDPNHFNVIALKEALRFFKRVLSAPVSVPESSLAQAA